LAILEPIERWQPPVEKIPCPIKIPCHRVIASNGKIGDYLGEKESPKKITLLKTEGFKV
jgi:O6-methylguanine-DNA--protein-cysteine methyltransferase